MVCDEVMAGFGRTGRLFGFCHAPSVVPDIVTFAKVPAFGAHCNWNGNLFHIHIYTATMKVYQQSFCSSA
jgi:4-aminobutyrate aminotransferase-like enzyme